MPDSQSNQLIFRCRKFDIQNELEAISSVVDKKSKDEIYACIYFTRSTSGSIMMAASSRELMVLTSIKVDSDKLLVNDPVSTGEKLAMAVNAERLLAICRKLPDRIIEFIYDKTQIRVLVRCDKSHYTLACQEPTFFPAITFPEVSDFSYRIPLRFFHSAIRSALSLVVGDTESPYVFYSGVLVVLSKKILTVIATDGCRMMTSYTKLETDKEFTAILPRKILSELNTTLEKCQLALLNLEITPNHAFFNFGKYTYCSSILAGNFPNYHVLLETIYKENTNQYRINRSKLQAALERCLVFVDKKQGFGVNIDFKEKELVVSGASQTGDSAFEIVEAECSHPFSVRLNGQYLKEYLETIQDEYTDLWLNNELTMKPILARSQSDRNYSWILQVMERM